MRTLSYTSEDLHVGSNPSLQQIDPHLCRRGRSGDEMLICRTNIQGLRGRMEGATKFVVKISSSRDLGPWGFPRCELSPAVHES